MHSGRHSVTGPGFVVRWSVLLLLVLFSGSCGGGGAPTAVSASGAPPIGAAGGSSPDAAAVAKALAGRTLVGYQGWFGCPKENELAGAGAAGGLARSARWRHWFGGQVDDAAHLTVDMLPDVTMLPAAALCRTGLLRPDGSAVEVFSSANATVLDLHFAWMKAHGIDGAAVQRFVTELQNPADRDRSNAILRMIRDAAQAHDRVFYVSYDISGADPATVYRTIRADWADLTGTQKITDSRAYLSMQDRPFLQIWGFGFKDRPGEPAQVLQLLSDLRLDADAGREPSAPTREPLVIGGVPAGWRTADGDSKRGDDWGRVYRSFQVISPWAVGRYQDEAGNQRFVDELIGPDLAETERLGIAYLPVIFPGFSWANLMTVRGETAAAIQNRTPRRCGNFLWQQGQSRIAAGARSLFIAMFDEVDEATAIMPVVARTADLPAGTRLIALDHDGCDLPPDWYLRVSGGLADHLRRGQVPPPALSSVLRP